MMEDVMGEVKQASVYISSNTPLESYTSTYPFISMAVLVSHVYS